MCHEGIEWKKGKKSKGKEKQRGSERERDEELEREGGRVGWALVQVCGNRVGGGGRGPGIASSAL